MDACVPADRLVHAAKTSTSLTVEAYNAGALGTTYRFYVNASMTRRTRFSAVFGNDESALGHHHPRWHLQRRVQLVVERLWHQRGALRLLPPDLEYGSYATIGLDGPAGRRGRRQKTSVSPVQDASQEVTVSGYFQAGGTELPNTLTGASWYVLNTAANALPTDGRWLIVQITTAGSISGNLQLSSVPAGDGANQLQKSADFDGAGDFPQT